MEDYVTREVQGISQLANAEMSIDKKQLMKKTRNRDEENTVVHDTTRQIGLESVENS